MADPKPALGLLKQHSWSPDTDRDEAWLRRKGLHRGRRGRPERSVTDDDLDELRGCIDLGFRFEIFDTPATGDRAAKALSRRLSETFPALDLYYAVHRSYGDSVPRSTPSDSCSSASADDGSPMDSPLSIFSPGESPEVVKARLKQWAQVVACSVRQRY
uniref:Uncharacterized protein LOC105060904 n=2 Tax=Elaeis guineensis var. tenera TaxID=51953 RepID=A0A6I9SH87_ELAGV|nr:uncharacterized protein LOC105060904 [Elaeis guineensis]